MSSVTNGAAWPRHPLLYEIHTAVWLSDLSARYGRAVTLADVPDDGWASIAELGVDAVWLMGVWERSPAGVALALANDELLAEFRHVLPDLTEHDVLGSAYCIRSYLIDARFGGTAGLASARAQLARHGLRLVVDYVPNHVAPDHPWTELQPDCFVQGDAADLERDPTAFIQRSEHVLARGRDPCFSPWPDVVQLNAFSPVMRAATAATLLEIAQQADGVRCDMAMLMINRIFAQTWGERVGSPPEAEFWPFVIGEVRRAVPDCCFIAEAYWDLEWELQQQGFDYCYDKRLYDRLVHEGAEAVRGHLSGDSNYQRKLLRFIENHDEPRSAATFAPEQLSAGAVVALTLPGARLLYEGQLEGRRVRPPVFLARHSDEPVDAKLLDRYRRLLAALTASGCHKGDWSLRDTTGWSDNASHEQLLTWSWDGDGAGPRALAVVNYAASPAQGIVHLSWHDLDGNAWLFRDLLAGVDYQHDGAMLEAEGLYVELPAWSAHLFAITVA